MNFYRFGRLYLIHVLLKNSISFGRYFYIILQIYAQFH